MLDEAEFMGTECVILNSALPKNISSQANFSGLLKVEILEGELRVQLLQAFRVEDRCI